jgi:hypothetical protein
MQPIKHYKNSILASACFIVILGILSLQAIPYPLTTAYHVYLNPGIEMTLAISVYLVPICLGIFFADRSNSYNETKWLGHFLLWVGILLMLIYFAYAFFAYALSGA